MKLATLTSTQDIDGRLRLTAEYRALGGIARIDLINDWLGLLTELHAMEMADTWGHEYTPAKICRDDIYGWGPDAHSLRLKVRNDPK